MIEFSALIDFSNKNMTLTDTRNYAGEGLSSGVGIFKITDPLGNVFYEHSGFAASTFASPDVEFGVSSTFTTLLPLGTDSKPLEGIYVVEMKNQAGSPSVVTELTQKFNYSDHGITLNIGSDVECGIPSVKVTDNTVYGQKTVGRAWNIYYPSSLNLPALTGTNETYLLQAPTIVYTGSYEAQLVSTLSYTIAADTTLGTTLLSVIGTLSAEHSFMVDCDTLCAAYDCVKAMNDHYTALLASDTKGAALFRPRLDSAMRLLELILAGLKCGKNVASLFTALKEEYSTCGCDQTCDTTTIDTTPKVINPNCPDLNIAVVTAGTGITVTPTTVGNTTTYNVALTAASTVTATVTPGTPRSVSVTNNSVGNNYSHAVNMLPPEAWLEVSSFLDVDFVPIDGTTPEDYLSTNFKRLAYRIDRSYVRSDSSNCSLIRLSGAVRLNRTGGDVFDELFDLPTTTGTSYVPTEIVSFPATLHTGGRHSQVQVVILTSGRVRVEGNVDLSTLTPIVDTPNHFILNIEHTFEGVEKVP